MHLGKDGSVTVPDKEVQRQECQWSVGVVLFPGLTLTLRCLFSTHVVEINVVDFAVKRMEILQQK